MDFNDLHTFTYTVLDAAGVF